MSKRILLLVLVAIASIGAPAVLVALLRYIVGGMWPDVPSQYWLAPVFFSYIILLALTSTRFTVPWLKNFLSEEI